MKTLFIGFQEKGKKGPIFEDGPNFDLAFKFFHGKDGVVPLSGRSECLKDHLEADPTPCFNPLAAKAATISLSAFGPGGPFGFNHFSEKWKLQKKKSDSKKRESKPKVGLNFFLVNILLAWSLQYS